MILSYSKNTNKIIFFAILSVKVILMLLFSSDYQNKLFIPFIKHFLLNFDNSWEYFFRNNSGVEFPYPPLMLYTLSLFFYPIHKLGINNFVVQNMFFKLPILFSDIVILYILNKIVPTTRRKEVLIFYFASPIIIYATFMHSQLDIIPTAILMVSIYMIINKKLILSSVMFGLALSTKFHVLVALPLILVYIIKNYKLKYVVLYFSIPVSIYCFFAFPYIISAGYQNLVLSNQKQMLIFDVVFNIETLKIYLPIFSCIIIYMRFFMYEKTNTDLFLAFLTMLFACLVFIIKPAPGWYIWILPFIVLLFIKIYQNDKRVIYFNFALSSIYLLFFVFFYIPDHVDLIFMSSIVNLKIDNSRLINLCFTVLEAVLLIIIYLCYKFGVKSNNVYKKKYAIVLGISGDSGAGKSTLLADIKLLFGNRLIQLEGDADHKWERGDENWKQYTHLHPKANMLHQQASDILALKKGKKIFRREYDHSTGKMTPPKLIDPNKFIILCGLHTFYLPKMRKMLDLKIFIDTDDKLRKLWKIKRDVTTRGYESQHVIEHIESRKEDSIKYIYPQKSFADIVVKYYSDDVFDLFDKHAIPKIKLKVTIDSSFHIEELISELNNEGISIFWDYADDLQRQYAILENPIEKKIIERISSRFIINFDEIVGTKIEWIEGYRGFIQLVILLSLSEKLKNKEFIENNNDTI